MSSIKPIKVYGQGGPNPPKVGMVIEELDLPKEIINTQFSELKGPEYLAVNPNGRMPAIYDPNTDLTLWESGAILQYLVERYDTEHKISFKPGTPEAYLAQQWLFFQTTGQGPYYGQAVWFRKFHHESLPSAKERYSKEVNRVTGVLEGHLKKEKEKSSGGDGPWLVGGKFSYADLAFVPWQVLAAKLLEKEEYNDEEYPLVKEWIGKMLERKGIKTAWDRAQAVH